MTGNDVTAKARELAELDGRPFQGLTADERCEYGRRARMALATYTFERVMDAAETMPDHPEYKRATITLAVGETAWHPGSTKHLLQGPATIEYTIHPSQITFRNV